LKYVGQLDHTSIKKRTLREVENAVNRWENMIFDDKFLETLTYKEYV